MRITKTELVQMIEESVKGLFEVNADLDIQQVLEELSEISQIWLEQYNKDNFTDYEYVVENLRKFADQIEAAAADEE